MSNDKKIYRAQRMLVTIQAAFQQYLLTDSDALNIKRVTELLTETQSTLLDLMEDE